MNEEFGRAMAERHGLGDRGLMNSEAALLSADPTPKCQATQASFITHSYAEALGLKAQIYCAWLFPPFAPAVLARPAGCPQPC